MKAAMEFKLDHLQSMLFFAVLISIAFGFLSRRRPIDRGEIYRVVAVSFSLDRRGNWLGDVSVLTVKARHFRG